MFPLIYDNPPTDLIALIIIQPIFDYIDDWHYLSELLCLQTPSTLIIPPDATLVFKGYHNNSYYLPNVGNHNFMGILIGYDTATTTFTINEPVSVELIEDEFPNQIILEHNYPNPFNPVTKIKFTIPLQQNPLLGGDYRGGLVTLKVYDILGKEIATLVNEEKSAGNYEVEFSSHSSEVRNLTSGVYFYQLKSGSFVETKKMLLIK